MCLQTAGGGCRPCSVETLACAFLDLWLGEGFARAACFGGGQYPRFDAFHGNISSTPPLAVRRYSRIRHVRDSSRING